MSGSHMSVQSQIDSFIKACKTGDLSCVQEILNAAADLDASRSLSQTIHTRYDYALRCAAMYGHESVCRLLIEHGANIHAQDDYALQLAAENGHEAVCRLLIEHGANTNADHNYALQLAAENGHEAVCRLLIEHGVNIRAENDYALQLAAENGHEAICRLLIEGRDPDISEVEPFTNGSDAPGANIHARDDYALQLAAKNGHEAICQLLLELDPLMARHIKPKYSREVLRVFQAYGDHDAITEALTGSSRRSPFTDDELDYIASCFISRKSAF